MWFPFLQNLYKIFGFSEAPNQLQLTNQRKRPFESSDELFHMNRPIKRTKLGFIDNTNYITQSDFLSPISSMAESHFMKTKNWTVDNTHKSCKENIIQVHLEDKDKTSRNVLPNFSKTEPSKFNVVTIDDDDEDVKEKPKEQSREEMLKSKFLARAAYRSEAIRKSSKSSPDEDVTIIGERKSQFQQAVEQGNTFISNAPKTPMSSSREPYMYVPLKNVTIRPRYKLPNGKSQKSTLNESIRLDEKQKYQELLRSFMNSSGRFLADTQKMGFPLKQHLQKVKPIEKKSSGKVDVIDLTQSNSDDEEDVIVVDQKITKPSKSGESKLEVDDAKKTQEKEGSSVFETDWMENLMKEHDRLAKERLKRIENEKQRLEKCGKESILAYEEILGKQIQQHMKITEVILDDVAEEELELPVLTPEMEKKISWALLNHSLSETLVEAFNLKITRQDIHTLAGLNWLNDEVINFYMNLLIERGKLDNYPTVYAFNTFFYPRLLSGGHAALKRWTRKIDIFSHDLVIIPVHLGVHWCMSCIDFRNKSISYYDSMGAPNNRCLSALLQYLQAESVDKKKVAFNTNGWVTLNVQKIPQQMNGSDCGVFSCTYAEFLCRNAKLNFSQTNMPYFRRKMIYEILSVKLLM